MSSRSRFDNFIALRNINPARGRGFRAYLHNNTRREESSLDLISATSGQPGRQTNSSALVNAVASSSKTTSYSKNCLTLNTSSSGDVSGTFNRTASIISSSTIPVVSPGASL